MNLFLCLSFILCFKNVLMQMKCYECPKSTVLTKEYFQKYNCTFAEDGRSYKCCVQITIPFTCKFRRRSKRNFESYQSQSTFVSSNNGWSQTHEWNSVQVSQTPSDISGSYSNNQRQIEPYSQSNYPTNYNPNNNFNKPRMPQHTEVVPVRDGRYPTREYYSYPTREYGPYPTREYGPYPTREYDPYDTRPNVPYPTRPYVSFPTRPYDPYRPYPTSNHMPTRPIMPVINPNQHYPNYGDDDDDNNNNNNNNDPKFTSTPEVTSVKPPLNVYYNPNDERPIVSAEPTIPKVNPQPSVQNNVPEGKEINSIPSIQAHKNYHLLPETCGRQKFAGRIHGGEDAELGEFPWMSVLEYIDGKSVGFKCGGVLINSRYVLTAAHCIPPANVRIRVRFGEYNMSTVIDCNSDEVCNALPVNEEIEEVIVHPRYGPNIHYHYDIALLRLKNQISFTDFISPICLPINGEQTIPGKNLTMAGWGMSIAETPSSVLQKASIPYIASARCQEIIINLPTQLIGSQFCAGGSNSAIVCEGDSGGPLMSTSPHSGSWYTEGIISFMFGRCEQQQYPSVFTRVSSFLTWILDNIKA